MEPSAPMATSGSEQRVERGILGCHHSPIQTSPNCPDPSFRTSLRDCLGISHSSCAQGFFGAGLTQGRVNFWHKPSPLSVAGKKREARDHQSRLPLGTTLSPSSVLCLFLPTVAGRTWCLEPALSETAGPCYFPSSPMPSIRPLADFESLS